jgi:hypothetical protein
MFMKRIINTMLSTAFVIIGAANAMAIEEAPYTVLKSSDKFELREYAPHILAETIVDGDQEGAGNKGFRRLIRYISGDNRSQTRVAMTAPVSQEKAGKKISMTAPVGQQRDGDKWAVSFMMPSSYTLETLPVPDDPLITLRQVPSRQIAIVRYSGFWSEGNYRDNLKELQEWVRSQGLTTTGDPVWARYDPPWTLWFLRRNEILIPVAVGSKNQIK